MKNNFKFYIPIDTGDLIKSAEKAIKTNTPMRVKGVASTMDKDSDDETLDPDGFDVSYLLDSGFINWHHQSKTDPEAIIGEPIKAFVKNKQLHIEGELYPWSTKAVSVFNLAKSLAKTGSKRQLGWSIEGQATERDLLNQKFVKKARITGIAITPMPKNASTFVDIVKGRCTGYECSLEKEIEELEKANPNGGTFNILEVSQPDGTMIVVDKDLNIKITKALTTTSGAPTIKEDVEKREVNLTDLKGASVILQKAEEKNLINLSSANKSKIKRKFEDLLLENS